MSEHKSCRKRAAGPPSTTRTIENELKLGTLVAINLDPPIERPFSFVHQTQKFRLRAIEKLLDFARNYCKNNQ